MFEERPSPVVASAASARKLPRMALLALLMLFIIPGLLSRDFWSSYELTSFALVHTMINGDAAAWLLPQLGSSEYVTNGPLSLWVSAIFAKLFGFLFSEASASRLSVLVWFAIATSSVWYGTWYLARRAEAQPVVLAFGGEASPIDYGRVVADGALLMFVATFGLFVPMRQLYVETALVAIVAAFFFSLAWTFRRDVLAPLFTGITIGCAVLTANLFAGVSLLVIALFIHARVHAYDTPFINRATLIIVAACATFFIWPILAVAVAIETVDAWFDVWWAAQLDVLGTMRSFELKWMLENFIWFLWPLWPFALLALYAFRKQLDRTHIKLPLLIFIGLTVFSLLGHVSGERMLMTLTVPLCILGAFGLMSARRSEGNILDWFSATVFTLAIVTIWVYFIAWQTGWPPKMSKSIINLAPGIPATLHGLLFVLCFVTLLAWLALVLWRMNHSQVVAWKGPWLAAAGITALALTTVYLFEPVIDRARSFEPVVQEALTDFHAHAAPSDCIEPQELDATKEVLFNYYGLELKENNQCRFVFTTERAFKDSAYSESSVLGRYSRPRDRERFVLIEQGE